jgi:hypothetical protein
MKKVRRLQRPGKGARVMPRAEWPFVAFAIGLFAFIAARGLLAQIL